jgi:glycerol dehydrogenase
MMLCAFGSPGLYLQGPGALSRLAEVCGRPGSDAFAVIDPVAAESIAAEISAALPGVTLSRFSGECTAAEIDRQTEAAARVCAGSAKVILGIGGGKAIDVAKGVQIATGRPLVVVPTIASTDAPTSRLCVVYTPEHAPDAVRMMAANPTVVLVDTAVLARAPARFFVAGVGDALSKKFEAGQCAAAGGLNFFGHAPPALALQLAEACHATLLADAEAALAAVRRQTPDASFERAIEATILLSGLAFESGGLSVPHALIRGLAAVPALAGALHGEQVAYGLIVHLILAGDEAYLDRLLPLYRALGLPRSLSDMGLAGDAAAAIPQIAATSLARAPYIRNFASEITQARLEAALTEAEARFGRAR